MSFINLLAIKILDMQIRVSTKIYKTPKKVQ